MKDLPNLSRDFTIAGKDSIRFNKQMKDTLFTKILETLEKYGEGDSKIKYSTPLARVLTKTVEDHYKNKPKWWEFWKD